jgi:1-acyl-sn-glycerol-3-phosphate acyltransferase
MPGGRSWPVPGNVEVRFGKPLTFERYRLGSVNQLVLRAITDQIMYDIMTLSGLSYVDEYTSKAKARQSRARKEPAAPPAGRSEPAADEPLESD